MNASKIEAAHIYLIIYNSTVGSFISLVCSYIYVMSVHVIGRIFMVQNSFPMREWHVKHMEKTIIKFVTGISADANRWEKRQNKRYGGIASICKQIAYDIKHGATIEDVRLIVQKIRNDSSYFNLQKDEESMQRLDELDKQFLPSKEEMGYITAI